MPTLASADIETRVYEGSAKLIQVKSHMEILPGHTLDLIICKTSLRDKDCKISSKLLPLVVQLHEDNGGESLYDVYSFDNNGICLSHGYSRRTNGRLTTDEQHDRSVDRLVEKGKHIAKMLTKREGDLIPVHPALLTHTTYIDLINNNLVPRS